MGDRNEVIEYLYDKIKLCNQEIEKYNNDIVKYFEILKEIQAGGENDGKQ